MTDDLLSVTKAREIAAEKGIDMSNPTVWRIVRRLGGHKVGGRYYISKSVWLKYLDGGNNEQAEEA